MLFRSMIRHTRFSSVTGVQTCALPIWLRLWFGDEEFPASGRLFLDESAAHYLTVEDAVTVGGLLLERLAGGPLLG